MMIVTQSPPKSLSRTGRTIALGLLGTLAMMPARGQVTGNAAPAALAAAPAEGAAIDVAPGGATLQDAIDRAPAGAVIRLAAGVYPDAITITKPLTLLGAGWQQTTLGSNRPQALSQARKDEFLRKLDAATDPQERARIAQELAAVTQPATVAVKGAAGVAIRGVRVIGPATGGPDGFTNETLVHFDDATEGVVSACAVVGPASNGVTIVNGSDVRVEKSLVAAIWNTGVRVYAGGRDRSDAKPAKVNLVDSDVRNCYHRCVTISGDGSVIERNRISGSAWHGIRYDHCSPTIRNNLIFGSARSGIYASGKTAATVTGNVFWRNEMGGMSCWFNNADTIEGNTFVANLRDGLAVLGASTPTLANNVFAQSALGVAFSRIGGNNQDPQLVPTRFTSNVFFGNQVDVQVLNEPKPLPEGNTVADPEFVAPENGDFTLAPDSPARKLGAGAADPIPLASPFPIQPGETAMVPDSETRDYQKWKKPQPADAAAAAGASGNDEIRLAAAADTPVPAKDPPAATTTAATEKHRERQRAFAKARVRQDARRFSKDQVAEVEALYQVANKDWRSDAARASLRTLIDQYPEMNRTGCAVLSIGQWSTGDEREQHFRRAAEKHGDCFYANGVQVGALARYLLGHHYKEKGKAAEAEKLFDEIRRNYPEAITARGDLLVAVLREEAKGTTRPNTSTQPAEYTNQG